MGSSVFSSSASSRGRSEMMSFMILSSSSRFCTSVSQEAWSSFSAWLMRALENSYSAWLITVVPSPSILPPYVMSASCILPRLSATALITSGSLSSSSSTFLSSCPSSLMVVKISFSLLISSNKLASCGSRAVNTS